MRTLKLFVCVLAFHGVAAAASHTPLTTVEGISEYRLKNGLRVLLFPDASKPTVTVNVTYFVGSRHEGAGETGMAHLLEHMLFKSTKTRKNIMNLLGERGANFNGSTSYDRTNYFETLPANAGNVKWALELEADRMANSLIAKEDLAKEWSVVKNEFEIHENFATGVLSEQMRHAAFEWHSYGRAVIGSASDIERVPVDNLRAFYKKFYQPDQAMLVVAGRFDPEATLGIIDASFGKIAKPTRTLTPPYTVEPVQEGERLVTLRRITDVGAVALLYHAVAGASVDQVPLQAAIDILVHRPGGRLQKTLIDSKLAAEINGGSEAMADPGMLEIIASVRADQSAEKVRDQMIASVEGLGASKIAPEELERFRAATLRQIELALTNSEQLGVELSEWAAQGDWRLLFIFRDRVKTVTVDDVQRVAKQYLKPANRTLGILIPEKAPDRAPLPVAPDVAKIVDNYRGAAALSEGETFDASYANIDARTQRVTLPSGLQLVLLPKKTRGAAVQIRLTVRSGTEKELAGKHAVASFVRDATTRGTAKHSYQELRDRLDRLRADLKGDEPSGSFAIGADDEPTYRVATVRTSVSEVLTLLAEMVRTPSFPATELEKLRTEKLTRQEMMRNEPLALALTGVLGRVQPWPVGDPRHVNSPEEALAELKGLKLGDVAAWHKDHWGGEGAVLTLVGDFDAAQVKAQVERELGDWKAPRPWQRLAHPYRESSATATPVLVATPDKKMAMVGSGVSMPVADTDPDAMALDVASYIFGGGAKSRLMTRLREKEGWSYTVFSFLTMEPFEPSAQWVSFAMCAPKNADRALGGLDDELDRLLKNGISAAELGQAKAMRKSERETQLADDEALAMSLDQLAQQQRTMAWEIAQEKKEAALTPTVINAALQRHLKPTGFVKVKAGDLK